jgi:hypothetical protein
MNQPRRGSFAIAYTIRNEEDTIQDAIEAHLRLGVERIYVFFDGTTDGSRERVSGMDRVECHETLHPDALKDLQIPEWILGRKDHFEGNMDVRKQVNTWRATLMSRERGIGWLLSIDPDEIFYPIDAAGQEVSAAAFFGSIPAETDQVLLRNLELVVEGPNIRDAFREGQYFLDRFPVSEEVCRYISAGVRKITRSPKMTEWSRYFFYVIRFRGAASRMTRHPTTGTRIPVGYFMGYRSNKSAIRSSGYSFSVHHWRPLSGTVERSAYLGRVLHYDFPNADSVMRKFGQRQKTRFQKNAYTRNLISEVVQDCPEHMGEVFADLCFANDSRRNRLIRRGIVREIDWTIRLLGETEAVADLQTSG